MIDKKSRIPFYLQVEEDLLKKIEDGIYKEEQKIPSEEELCNYYDVSRPTIRQSIKELLNEGRLIIKKGKGTFVVKKKFESLLIYSIPSFYDELMQKKIPFKDKIISSEIIKPTIEIAKILKIKTSDYVIHHNRIRYTNGEPLYNTRSYIIKKFCPNLINEKIENHSLLHLLEDKYKLDFHIIRRYLQPILATTELSKLLDIITNTPIHYLETIILDKNETPFAYFKDYFRNDKSVFTFEIRKNKETVTSKSTKIP